MQGVLQVNEAGISEHPLASRLFYPSGPAALQCFLVLARADLPSRWYRHVLSSLSFGFQPVVQASNGTFHPFLPDVVSVS
jgi:hypothetical protein